MVPARRDTVFDAIRGYAALSVLVHHLLIVWPSDLVPAVHALVYYTPLEAFFSGGKGVRTFFVLSGFFLFAILAREARCDWRWFYADRLLRLYPAFALVVLLSAGLNAWIGATPLPAASLWFNTEARATDMTLADVVGILTFTGTASAIRIDCVTWSLVMEARFLMLLPLLYWAVRRHDLATCGAVTALAIVADPVYAAAGETAWYITAESWVGAVAGTAHFLPAFVFGMVLARRLPQLRPWVLALPTAAKIALLVVGFVIARRSQEYIGAIGICILVLLCLTSVRLARWTRHPMVERLGRGSYSIYLVHMPMTLLVVYLLHDLLPMPVILIAAFVASLAGALLLHRGFVVPTVAIGRQWLRRSPAVPAACEPAGAARPT